MLPPAMTLIPTVEFAPAAGWPPDKMPVAADGLKVNTYATGLDDPRWL
jgi:glucose/arabinose dehydrogenase